MLEDLLRAFLTPAGTSPLLQCRGRFPEALWRTVAAARLVDDPIRHDVGQRQGVGLLWAQLSQPLVTSAPSTLTKKSCAATPIERRSVLARLSTARAISSVTSRAQPSAVLKAITCTGREY